MTQKSKSIKCYETLKEFLCKPIEWFGKYDNNKSKRQIAVYILIFLVAGILLSTYYTFPYFDVYFCILNSIALIVWESIKYYSINIREIVTNLKVLDTASIAYDYYDKYIWRNPLYTIFPCTILFIFGVGGISMSDVLVCDLLLCWVMALFSVVVYISIIGYVEFFC